MTTPYSCLENAMDRGAWQAAVHGIAESDPTEQLTLSLSQDSLYLLIPDPFLVLPPFPLLTDIYL